MDKEQLTKQIEIRYRTVMKEEQAKDLVSLLLEGCDMDVACSVVAEASLFNAHIDIA